MQCDISCAQCTSADGCSLCYDQMYLVPIGNKVLCDYCSNTVSGCTVCASAYKCSICSNGYYLLPNSTCAPCSNLTPNCALCYQNVTANSTGSENYCVACTQPYFLVDQVCSGVQRSSAVTTVPASNSSSQQSQQSQQSASNTPQTTPSAQKSSRTQPSSGGQAAVSQPSCDLNFILVGTICARVIPFCAQYSPTSLKCDICADSYTKSR